MKTHSFDCEFIDEFPPVLAERMLYVSTLYASALHLCACGCGIKVFTPLSPDNWSIIFDGVSISLTPSIGNWSFPCQSHYWIRRGDVIWSDRWSDQKIEANREADHARRERHSTAKYQTAPTVSTPRTRFALWFRKLRR
ncbi:DUF6527 family protein [Cryobacterium sp. TMT4-10]|uniref:DUF6527 family protein n=1 Tax=Cryobacterium sp. TMT4-10 TaxID=1259256 RepID=UPI001580DF01|nr:DUF6527 family protein [Cryobacterium sp. TMT4-10]